MNSWNSELDLALNSVPIMPVLTVKSVDEALWIIDAVAEGGMRCAEIAMRTDVALEAIAAAVVAAPTGFVVGAGTVLTTEQVDAVADACGAFVVSPGYSYEVLGRARARGVDAIPGVGSATDVMSALRDGVHRVKLFPAQHLGGVGFLDALRGPFPHLKVLPSGGVDGSNALTYLNHPSVFAISGGWVVPTAAVQSRNRGLIVSLCHAAVQLVHDAATSRAKGSRT
jgi:2-dehydro-3-deoxyphosphogluconate aldolase/(4S)-4-hydroxy-2-oxoglutarate aldolase